MDPESPQQSPVRSKQERVRARKLRNSCDACSNSKTKCDQTRPVCIRCQKNGLDCNYSVSQRKGKPPAASRHPSGSTSGRKAVQERNPSRPMHQRISSSGLDSLHNGVVETPNFHSDRDSSIADIFLPMPDDIGLDFSQPFRPDMSDFTTNGFSMTPSNIFDHGSPSMNTSSMVLSHQNKSTSDIFNFMDEFPGLLNIGPPLTLDHADLSIPTNPLLTPTPSDIQSPSPRYDCNRLASATLDSLDINSRPCAHAANSSIEPTMASLDKILITNKSAIENAHQLLSCSCSLSQQSSLTLSLIIDKILTLYQTVIHTDVYASGPRPLSPCSDTHTFTERPVTSTPITIGAYKMDPKDEQRMRVQIVSNELRKVAALVERYCEKYCGLGGQETDDKGIHTALTNLLRRRLREVVGDIVNALRIS